jgi:hypothetical protein
MADTIQLEWLKTELMNRLRWEDDGGQNIENNDSILDRQFVQPALPTTGMHATSLQWNEQFSFEPFQAGTRIDLIKRKASTKRPSL